MFPATIFHISQNLMLLLDRSAIGRFKPVLAQATGMPIIGSENTATIALLLIAAGILSWGFYRARPFGKLGILAWLQSVALMSPWLLFFSLFAAGIYLNLVAVLLLLVTSTGLYIYLGRQLRQAASDSAPKSRDAAEVKSQSDSLCTPDSQPDSAKETIKIVTPPPATNELEIIPVPVEDLKAIKSIFGIDTFFATETIPYQDGVILKGNLRGDAEQVHSRLTASLQERLNDRYRLFLVDNQDDKPIVIILPSTNDPQPTTVSQKILAVVLLLATIATSLETGGLLLGFDFFNSPDRYLEVLPIAAGIWAVLGSGEIARRVVANRYEVGLSWPFFIPTLQIGCFGAIDRFESLLPNRKVLFDIAFAGAAAGGIVSILMLVTGLLLSHPGSLFQVPAEYFKGSVLVGALTKVVLGSALQQQIVDVHPLVVIGWLGLVITAINLMPAGQLDGGRIVQAIYGRKIASRATLATFVVLAIASLVNPLALYWAIVILILQRNLERPSLNELTEPDDARAALGLLALFLMIAALLPLTPALAGRLGIGN
ncbi:site-2 protease family protein [Microcoleus sp. LEGE 07076]|uniref:site-2 protease family protein n=1 Tax=Microcoleus sp. LEGE 07076 TaxID=915322 RepID=UPI00187F44CB|nr:site-2 protease family protein [Microcoleus sp. LEGE 07076]MBE9184735.1 site-2 protease family protein [Microcoleus sp. LEGE 07076]